MGNSCGCISSTLTPVETEGLTPDKFEKWSKIRERIQPLDVIYFRGGELVSDFISLLQEDLLGYGEWSHLGIVVTSDLLNDSRLKEGTLYVWESTYSGSQIISDGVGDYLKDEYVFGAQLRDLNVLTPAYLKSDGAKMGWSKLINNPWSNVRNRKHIQKLFTQTFNDLKDTPYDYRPLTLLSSIFPELRKLKQIFNSSPREDVDKKKLLQKERDSMLFCSEMVATVYQRLGIISKSINTETVVPVDFLGYDQDGMRKVLEEPITISF